MCQTRFLRWFDTECKNPDQNCRWVKTVTYIHQRPNKPPHLRPHHEARLNSVIRSQSTGPSGVKTDQIGGMRSCGFMKLPQVLLGEYGRVTVSSCTAHSWRYFCAWKFRDRNSLRIRLLSATKQTGFLRKICCSVPYSFPILAVDGPGFESGKVAVHVQPSRPRDGFTDCSLATGASAHFCMTEQAPTESGSRPMAFEHNRFWGEAEQV